MGAIGELAPALVAVTARCLRIPPGELDPSAPLARYGLDSLNALELSIALTEATGRDVPADLFLDSPSLNDLAAQLGSPNRDDTKAGRLIERMLADARLPLDIDPSGLPVRADGAALLTGATGFLGAYLLSELVAGSERAIICPVRAANDAHASDRLRATLRHHRLAITDFDRRVHAIAADVARPGWGLPAADYASLADRVAVVYHGAAQVNWSHGYETLRVFNVNATVELLRFACIRAKKRVVLISSAAACLSSVSGAAVTEESDAAAPAGIHFGYGQTKWVAERLLEEAKRRGLDAIIVRPSLITVNSETGAGNDEDFLARMLRGVIALGYAPDIAWRLDACPVQHVARAIKRIGEAPAALPDVLHLRNPYPSRWNELVLWLNLRGYPVALEPFQCWIARVDRATLNSAHVLHPLRAFLLKQPLTDDARYLPQLYADPHVARFDAACSDTMLARIGVSCPRVGADVMNRMFDAWARRRVIAPAGVPRGQQELATGFTEDQAIERAVRIGLREQGLVVRTSSHAELATGQSILGELAAWHSGSGMRMHARTLHIARADGTQTAVEVVVKPLVSAQAALDVTAAVTKLGSKALEDAFHSYRPFSELQDATRREIAIYGCEENAIAAVRPKAYGSAAFGRNTVLLIEKITDADIIDAVEHIDSWTRARTHAAIAGIARVHAKWLGRESDVDDLLGVARCKHGAGLDASAAWCQALSDYVRPWLEATIGTRGAISQGALARRVRIDFVSIATLPHTLIHHDFNPRNIALRSCGPSVSLCAYDWELACYGLPQRDVVELLCFVLPPDVTGGLALEYLDAHRRGVEALSGQPLDALLWIKAARLAAADFAVRRLPLYVLADRFKPMPYLARVAKTWERLYALLTAAAPESAGEAA